MCLSCLSVVCLTALCKTAEGVEFSVRSRDLVSGTQGPMHIVLNGGPDPLRRKEGKWEIFLSIENIGALLAFDVAFVKLLRFWS